MLSMLSLLSMYSLVIPVIYCYPCFPVFSRILKLAKKNKFFGIKSVPIQGFEKALRTQLTQRSPLAVG